MTSNYNNIWGINRCCFIENYSEGIVIHDYENKNIIIKDTNWEYLENTEENQITLITCVENEPEFRRCIQAVEKEEEDIY